MAPVASATLEYNRGTTVQTIPFLPQTMKRPFATLVTVLVASIMVAMGVCAQDQGLSQRQMRKYQALFLEAVCQREAGNLVAYYRMLERAVKVNPDGAEALYELARCGMSLDTPVPVVEYLERAHEINPDNGDYTYELGRVYLALSDPHGLDIMQGLTHDPQYREDAYGQLCAYYEMTRNYDSLCVVLEQWRPIKGDDEFITSNKFQAAMGMNRYADALSIADTLVAAYPGEHSRYLIYKGEALLGLGRYDEVLQICQTVDNDDDLSPNAQLLLYRYALATNNSEVERQAYHEMVLNPRLAINTRIAALQGYIHSNTTAERRQRRDSIIAELLPLEEEDATIYAFLVDQMQNENVADSVMLPLYNKMLDINPADEYSRLHLMQNALIREDYDELDRLSTDGLKENPSHPLFYYFAGAALQIAKKDSESLEMFSRGLKYINSNTHTELVSSYYSAYADALHKNGRKEEAYTMYDSALVYNNDNIMCLNNYAYFLSLDNVHLDRAKQMSAKTLESDPDEPTYLDTYAWILFLCGELAEARKYIDKALEKSDLSDPDNATLLDHAGDIYYHLDLRGEAADYWRKALELDPDNALLRKKASKQKYYAN